MRDFFTTHPLMKFFSLCLAIVVWFLVRVEQYTEVNMTSKVLLRNVPENLIVRGEVENEIRIRLSGPSAKLRQIRTLEPVMIDLQDAKIGVNAFAIYGDEFKKLPTGVHVIRIAPQIIRVVLDQVEERLVKVEPTFSGVLQQGLEVVDTQVIPSYFKVRGARTELENIGVLKTVPIVLNEYQTSFEGSFPLRSYPAQWELQDKLVHIKVTLKEKAVRERAVYR